MNNNETTAIPQTDWLYELFVKNNGLPIMRYVRFDEKTIRQLVSKGAYCYDKNGTCPFWDKLPDASFPEQCNGYCSLLERGDFMSSENGGTMLLWDQCKECGINDES